MMIEKLKKENIPELLELYEELIPFEFSSENSDEAYKEIMSNKNYSLLAAKEGNKVIGSALVIYCKALVTSFLVIEDVIVKSEFRGKGIGKKLMEAIDQIAKNNHCDYAILVSSANRKPAHKFYEHNGFTDSVVGFRKLY